MVSKNSWFAFCLFGLQIISTYVQFLLLQCCVLGISVANALLAEQRQQAEALWCQQAEAQRWQQQERQRVEALAQEQELQCAAASAAAQLQQQQALASRARALAKQKQKEEERRLRKERMREAQHSRQTVPAAVTEDSAEGSNATGTTATTDAVAVPAAGNRDGRLPESSRKRQHELLEERPSEPGGGQLVLFLREARTEPSPKKNKNDCRDLPPLLGTEPWNWSEESTLNHENERAPAFAEEIDSPPDSNL